MNAFGKLFRFLWIVALILIVIAGHAQRAHVSLESLFHWPK